MVEASCGICFDDFPIRDFRVYSCGHCFCVSCVSSLKAARCPVCRVFVSPPSGKQLYLNVVEPTVDKADLVLREIERLGVETEAKSVRRVTREIDKVINTTEGTGDDFLRLVLEEVQEFKKRIIPLFESREILAGECDFLQAELSTTKSQAAERLSDLKKENRDLRIQLQDARHVSTDSSTTVPQVAVFPGQFIPQRRHSPQFDSNHSWYVELNNAIYFRSENPEEDGIALSDALHSRLKRFLHRDEPVYEISGPSVFLQLAWPGYAQWNRQIPTRDTRSPPRPITKAHLAKVVAKCVFRFIMEKTGYPLEIGSNERWQVGDEPGQIKLNDLVLVSLHHVSTGTWQPHLRLRGIPWLA